MSLNYQSNSTSHHQWTMFKTGLTFSYRGIKMNKILSIIGILVFSATLFVSCSDNQQSGVVEDSTKIVDVKILQTWQGDYPVDQLNLLPEGQRGLNIGYIRNSESFSAIWNQFKPNKDVPGIDFGENFVLFARNIQYYNRISIGKVTLKKGVVDILAMETMSAMPIEANVALSLAVVPRKGITAIKLGDDQILIK